MADPVDILDLAMEREVFDPPVATTDEMENRSGSVGEEPADPDEAHMIPMDATEDVDEIEPTKRVLKLSEAKEAAESLFAFVSENRELIDKGDTGSNSSLYMMDRLRYKI